MNSPAGEWQPQKDYESHPIGGVTWYGANEFCQFYAFKLPTEAQWEYAVRSGGKNEKWAGTNDESKLVDYAWYDENSGSKTHPIGQKKPNGLGLYDMNGNVWEWCQDRYDNSYYSRTPSKNPTGAESGNGRVLRGGSWSSSANLGRFSRCDNWSYPDSLNYSIGFRVLR